MLKKIMSFLFGKSIDYKKLVDQGAIIIDVRSYEEFNSGHIKEAKNVPLQSLLKHIYEFKKNIVIITCCHSGIRSSRAKSILKDKGFEVYNGGSWVSLNNKLYF